MRPSVPLGHYDPSAMDGIEIRVAQPDDFDDIVEVCSASLGWKDPDFDRALFRWKHAANPFGRSLIMVAELDGRLVAVRPFMRWRFRRGDDILTAARAVDTATHPDARGKGLFRTLTEAGIELLREEGVDFIFNTPNDQSRPGYLKMGWVEAGHIPVGFRPRSIFTLANLRGARVPATKASLPMDFGLSVEEGLAATALDDGSVERWVTDHDLSTLRWRFSQGPVTYRWVPGPSRSGVIVRARRRGTATELLLAATVGMSDPGARASAVRSALQRSNADYCLGPVDYPKMIPVSRLGPLLTVRTVTTEPRVQDHRWEPGDLELF